MKKTNNFLNKLLHDSKFLVALCNYSNNDIEMVTKNLSSIIEYYMTNPDDEYPNNLEKLFQTIAKTPRQNNYHIIPYNGYYKKALGAIGINPDLYYHDALLFWLNSLLTYQPSPERFVIYDNVEEAVYNGFTSPQMLYKQILKQPANRRQDLSVGDSECDYYSDVMTTRLEKTKYANSKKVQKLAKKVLKKYMDKGVILCFVKQSEVKSTIQPNNFMMVTLPSKHQLENICAFNKNYHIGSKISSNKPVEPKENQRYSSLRYSRVELVPIDDTFVYNNPELSGDVSYDIDTVYGKLDYKCTKDSISSNPNENIANIKDLNDIRLTRFQGEYFINNGRHRIVYLKNYYEKNKAYYESIGKLKELKKYLTIPVSVELTIEDKEVNDLLTSLERTRPKIRFLKADITNDDLKIVIIDQGNAYYVESERDILELSKYLLSNETLNRFHIGNMTKYRRDYHELFYHLTATLKEEFFNMSFIDLINYLKANVVIVNGHEYDGNTLDYLNLHACYTELNHRVTIGRIRSNSEQIIKDAEAAEISIQLGNLLTSIFKSKPELILLDVDSITKLVKTREEFANYPELVIKRSIENNEYRLRHIYDMLKESQESRRNFGR